MMFRPGLMVVAVGALAFACCQAEASAPPLQLSYDFTRGEALTYVRPVTWREGDFLGGRWRVAPAVGTSLADGRTLAGVVAGWSWSIADRATGWELLAGVDAYAFARPGQSGGGFGLAVTVSARF